MILKTLIVALILASIIALALGLKMWLDPDEETSDEACNTGADQKSNIGFRACQIKNLTNCATEKSTLDSGTT